DGPPITYLARMSAQATTIDRSLEPGPADARVSATTRDWKACMIGSVPLERLPNVGVSGSEDTVRQLIEATSLSGEPRCTAIAETGCRRRRRAYRGGRRCDRSRPTAARLTESALDRSTPPRSAGR